MYITVEVGVIHTHCVKPVMGSAAAPEEYRWHLSVRERTVNRPSEHDQRDQHVFWKGGVCSLGEDAALQFGVSYPPWGLGRTSLAHSGVSVILDGIDAGHRRHVTTAAIRSVWHLSLRATLAHARVDNWEYSSCAARSRIATPRHRTILIDINSVLVYCPCSSSTPGYAVSHSSRCLTKISREGAGRLPGGNSPASVSVLW